MIDMNEVEMESIVSLFLENLVPRTEKIEGTDQVLRFIEGVFGEGEHCGD